MKVCLMCDANFAPRARTSRFCSKRCAALFQHAVNPRPKTSPRVWVKTPEQQATYQSSEYRKARERVVAAAIGHPCPGCGVILTRANCQADHKQARAEGGRNDWTNLRALCAVCNHRRGAQLGGRVTAARRRTGKPSAINLRSSCSGRDYFPGSGSSGRWTVCCDLSAVDVSLSRSVAKLASRSCRSPAT